LPTTEFLKNIEVIDYEEVNPYAIDQSDFVIINAQEIINQIEVNDANELAEAEKEEEDQFTLAFDMPVGGTEKETSEVIAEEDTIAAPVSEKEEDEKPIIFDLTDDILEVEVNEPIEVVPVSESAPGGVRKYSLEDYMEEEKRLMEAKPESEVIEEDKEVILEKKTIEPIPSSEPEENADPVNQPISETLKARAAERRAKMKEFNYKFRNNSNIDDIEKEPAYKRAGLDVDSKPESSELSRTSLGSDSNDDIQLRKNNSFLHDNVD